MFCCHKHLLTDLKSGIWVTCRFISYKDFSPKFTSVESNMLASGSYKGVQTIFVFVCAGPGANPAAAGQQMPGQPGKGQFMLHLAHYILQHTDLSCKCF